MSAEDLAKRFAPILFLHAQEKFVPVDAKRFLENANLWRGTGAPLDSKAQWGTAPLIAAGGVSGIKTEPGTVIDDATVLPATGAELFLELGGWKDSSEMHEAGVTAASSNVYADRKSIEDLYSQPGKLKDSRFWYHAELFEGADFMRELGKIKAPEMVPLVPTNPAFLCYYFFFPAHRQSVSSATCNDIKAKEAACHAGDWQCMAILLEGDPGGDASKYKPVFFGCTGFAFAPSSGAASREGYGFDAEDGYPAMKVQRWRPQTGPLANQPTVEGASDHPRLFVALDTHSLYPVPGTYEVFPYTDGPTWCDTFDNAAVMPEDYGQPEGAGTKFLKGLGAFFGKVMAGFLAGGPPGMTVGAVAAAAEGYYPSPSGLDIVGYGDTPDPDKVPLAGTGTTIRPKGVNVAGVTDMLEDWAVEQNKTIGRHRYDYIVNRNEQRFWPNPDMELGYRGRWGQRVTSDAMPRRAGPKFPDYFRMFMMGLAAGDHAHRFDAH